ncbi:multicopper oxidase [Cadophora sp. DSE1049]|nr:multicopper oxidase [Cadophora sp. DSE1049]
MSLSLRSSTLPRVESSIVKGSLVDVPLPPINNVQTNRSAWGPYDIKTDYAYVVPQTRVTREYNFIITNTNIAPDGFERPGMVINGQYPGPLVEANWGDILRINVFNNLTNLNGTSIHFHGVRMLNQNFEDGTPGITECPIPPNSSKTYEFRVIQYGTTWYHSHFGLQYPDGLTGPMKFYGPTSQNYGVDLGPIMVNDRLHAPASSLYYLELEGTPPVASSILMQSQGIYLCQPGEPCIQRTNYYTVNFTAGTAYKMSLINSETDTRLTFWLQDHSFTIVGTDFVAIEPYVTGTINIAVGQRYEIIVTANATIKSDATEGNFWMHARDCSKPNATSTLGIIRYNASSTANPCETSGENRQNFGCADPPTSKLVPNGYPILTDLSGPLHKWILGKERMYLNWSEPTLKLVNDYANLREEHLAPSTAPIFLDYEAESWVYFLIQNNSTISSPDHMYYRAAHPIHLHGHDFVIIAQGRQTLTLAQS